MAMQLASVQTICSRRHRHALYRLIPVVWANFLNNYVLSELIRTQISEPKLSLAIVNCAGLRAQQTAGTMANCWPAFASFSTQTNGRNSPLQ